VRVRGTKTRGRFRQDLDFRLHMVSIRMPALFERRDDITLLFEHFLEKHRRKGGFSGNSAEAVLLFLNCDWSGTVVISRGVGCYRRPTPSCRGMALKVYPKHQKRFRIGRL
jgi:transcriptional regulator of aromatic amino acid metabolism